MCYLQGMIRGRDTRYSLLDVEELLNSPWIARIWTYQEAALCQNPVVVCGSAHIPWPYFACRIIFLRLATRIEDKYLRPWIELVVARAICRTKIGNKDLTQEQLEQYWTYCTSISQSYTIILISSSFLSAIPTVWTIFLVAAFVAGRTTKVPYMLRMVSNVGYSVVGLLTWWTVGCYLAMRFVERLAIITRQYLSLIHI